MIFFWVCVCGCDIFLGGCGWVWHFSGWGVGGCDIFLGGGEWV